MTEIIALNSENEPAAKFLEPYLQSGNLNFLIGSGASAPAIKTAGNIEAEINTLLAANNETDANKKSFEFITTISTANSKISTTWTPTGTCIFSGIAGQMPLKLEIFPLEEQLQPRSSTLQFKNVVPKL